ncbi:hypothetical protein CB1_000726025 [Camelus ferus]|nr:hypothetical protein CB1_000726025 [Camelus ferus]
MVTGACCLFLAGKVEETPKKCKDIIKTARSLLNDVQFGQFGDDPKEEVMVLERILLQTIKFDLQVEHPYQFLLNLCTTLSLQWEPEIIAVAVMYLAGRLCKFEIQEWTSKPMYRRWWEQFVQDVPVDVLEDICHQILDLYSQGKQQMPHHTPHQLQQPPSLQTTPQVPQVPQPQTSQGSEPPPSQQKDAQQSAQPQAPQQAQPPRKPSPQPSPPRQVKRAVMALGDQERASRLYRAGNPSVAVSRPEAAPCGCLRNKAVQAALLQETVLPVCWCERREMESDPWQPGCGRQRTMYNSAQKKKTVARCEGLPVSADPRQGQSTSTEERPYKGPLNWFPDRCCRIEGLELAASPSFLQTTCGEGKP